MAIRRAVLLIADIGGYTRFMQWNRMHLAHAQETVAELLEAVIDAGKGLKLAKLEGDAAFFWAPEGDAGDVVRDQLGRMRLAFLTRRASIEKDNACSCESCDQVKALSLKFVAHEGEVAEQKVKRLTELAGVDVILVHRMLKNDVPVSEYVLMTDAVKDKLQPGLAEFTRPLTHDFEGIGQTSTHYIDLHQDGEALPVVPRRGLLGRIWAKLKFEMGALPYLLGLKKPCEGFRHLGRATPENEPPAALPSDAGAP